MRIVAIILCGLLVVAVALEMDCPRPEWKKRRANNHCYWFETDFLPQYKADERCRRYNAKLAKIDDADENDWILKNVFPATTYIGGGDSSHYYIGLKRTSSNADSWYWELDGSPLDSVWGGSWKDGEPNNYHNKENCVTYFQDDGKWNDVMCGDSFHYICEYVIPPPPPTTAP
ncbi:asialoglycoprotein receptor 1-like [Amphiura filiformis]|uniref:asialoglycoprotein receptor 1-like n=1 Tax=Amphiura filiformis TaxID=82378 RepID=UPI003B2265CE